MVVPIGHHTEALWETMCSLRAQACRPDIAVYDASGDPRTKALLDSFQDIISYYHEGPDGGQAAVILDGWNRLGGRYVGWLNVDDALAPGALDHAAAMLDADAGLDAAYGPSIIVDAAGRLRGMHPAVNPDRLNELPRDCIISQPSCLARRTAVDAAGNVDPKMHYVMDWDLWTRMLLNGARFGYNAGLLSKVEFADRTKTASLSLGRLREVSQVVGYRGTLVDQCKTIGSIVLSNLSTYKVGGFAQNDTFFSVGQTRFPYWHFGNSPLTRLTVRVKHGRSQLQASDFKLATNDKLALPDLCATDTAGEFTLASGGSIPPGQLVWIEVRDLDVMARVASLDLS